MIKQKKLPYLLNFPKIGNASLGYISIAEKMNLPFIPKRIYWTYYTPEDVIRGGHSHFELEQILIAVSGKIEVKIELNKDEKFEYVLESPSLGLFVPKNSWRIMKYSHNAVQICIASMEYDEKDYLHNYDEFLKKN